MNEEEAALLSLLNETVGFPCESLWLIKRLGDGREPTEVYELLLANLPRISDVSLRFEIISKFSTPKSKPFVEELLRVIQTEDDYLCLSGIYQALSASLTKRNALRIWQEVCSMPPNEGLYLLMFKLYRQESFRADVEAKILGDIKNNNLSESLLLWISNSKVPVISNAAKASLGQKIHETDDGTLEEPPKKWTAKFRSAKLPQNKKLLKSMNCDIDEVIDILNNKVPEAARCVSEANLAVKDFLLLPYEKEVSAKGCSDIVFVREDETEVIIYVYSA